jgi:hypothetical protein
MIDDSWSASAAMTCNMASKTLAAFHRENLLCTVFHGPNRSGRSRHGAPVFAMYKTALMNSRFASFAGRARRPRSCASKGATRCHCSSVNS